MAASVLVDTGFLVALLSRRDAHAAWAAEAARSHPPPWHTCESVLSESFHLLGASGAVGLAELLLRRALVCTFAAGRELAPLLRLIRKYDQVPMSLADACLVRMTEIMPDPVLLTTDSDFRFYRRHSRQVVPCVMP